MSGLFEGVSMNHLFLKGALNWSFFSFCWFFEKKNLERFSVQITVPSMTSLSNICFCTQFSTKSIPMTAYATDWCFHILSQMQRQALLRTAQPIKRTSSRSFSGNFTRADEASVTKQAALHAKYVAAIVTGSVVFGLYRHSAHHEHVDPHAPKPAYMDWRAKAFPWVAIAVMVFICLLIWSI